MKRDVFIGIGEWKKMEIIANYFKIFQMRLRSHGTVFAPAVFRKMRDFRSIPDLSDGGPAWLRPLDEKRFCRIMDCIIAAF